MNVYDAAMLSLTAKILLLLSVLLMPLGMSPASAAEPHHSAAAMPTGHCRDQQRPADHNAGFAACTAACSAALPAAQTSDAEPLTTRAELPRLPATDRLRGLHPDTATPPPRAS